MALKINDNGTDRDMTKQEQTAYLAWAEIAQAAKEAAKQAVLDKLGLTADEAAALVG